MSRTLGSLVVAAAAVTLVAACTQGQPAPTQPPVESSPAQVHPTDGPSEGIIYSFSPKSTQNNPDRPVKATITDSEATRDGDAPVQTDAVAYARLLDGLAALQGTQSPSLCTGGDNVVIELRLGGEPSVFYTGSSCGGTLSDEQLGAVQQLVDAVVDIDQK